MTKVTYIPRDPTEPHVNIVHGIKFSANVPFELDPNNREHGYNQLVRKTIVDPVTGREMFEYKEQWVSLIETLKGNPSFHIEGEPQAVARKPGRPRTPRTSEDYRGHAQAWISASDDFEEMIQRWEDEEPLRERCEVGDDDKSYLRPFFDAKIHQLGGSPEKHPMQMVMAE